MMVQWLMAPDLHVIFSPIFSSSHASQENPLPPAGGAGHRNACPAQGLHNQR